MTCRSISLVALSAVAVLVAGCSEVLFVRDDAGVKKIYSMDSSGNNQRLVSPANATNYLYPAVSPDAQKVAYTDRQHVFISNLGDIGGGSQVQLSTGPGRKAQLRWAPSQQVVGYTQFSPANQGSVWLAATNGTNALQVTFPTGSQSGAGARREIFSVKLDGSDPVQLTHNAVYDSQPAAIQRPCY